MCGCSFEKSTLFAIPVQSKTLKVVLKVSYLMLGQIAKRWLSLSDGYLKPVSSVLGFRAKVWCRFCTAELVKRFQYAFKLNGHSQSNLRREVKRSKDCLKCKEDFSQWFRVKESFLPNHLANVLLNAHRESIRIKIGWFAMNPRISFDCWRDRNERIRISIVGNRPKIRSRQIEMPSLDVEKLRQKVKLKVQCY